MLLFQIASFDHFRCKNNTAIATCESCLALQDPFCAWSLISSKCVSINVDRDIFEGQRQAAHGTLYHAHHSREESKYLLQDIQQGSAAKCPRAAENRSKSSSMNKKMSGKPGNAFNVVVLNFFHLTFSNDTQTYILPP